MPKVTRQDKKKELERASKAATPKSKTHKNFVREEWISFEEALTFKTFRVAFDDTCKHMNGWRPTFAVSDSLRTVGHKIRIPELKKILKFLAKKDVYIHGKMLGNWRESIDAIICSHHDGNNWIDISDERLKCLLPYMNCTFWTSFFDYAPVVSANQLSVDGVRTVFDAVLMRRAV